MATTSRDFEQQFGPGPGFRGPVPAGLVEDPAPSMALGDPWQPPSTFNLPEGGIPAADGKGTRRDALQALWETLTSDAQFAEFAERFPGFASKFPNGVPSAGGGQSASGGGASASAGLSDQGLDFLNPQIASALDEAILGLLTNGGIVGTGFEDAANLLREEEKASTLRNMGRNAELFNSRNLLGSGPRLEAQTEIGDMGQQNLFQALVELELQRLGLMQQGQLGGISGALGAGRLGLDEFLAALQAANTTVGPGISSINQNSNSPTTNPNSNPNIDGVGIQELMDYFSNPNGTGRGRIVY